MFNYYINNIYIIINTKILKGIIIKEGTIRPGKGFNLYPHPFVQNQLSKRNVEIVENLKYLNKNEKIIDLINTKKWKEALYENLTLNS